MTPKEQFYFDSLFSQLTTKTFIDNPKVFFGPSCSTALVSSVVNRFAITMDRTTSSADINSADIDYDIIICTDKEISTVDDFTLYSNHLSEDGVIATLIENQSFLQSSGATSREIFRLNEELDNTLSEHRLVPIFREPIGKFIQLNWVSDTATISRILHAVGSKLPNSILYSPFLCLIYQKATHTAANNTPYISTTSLSSRVKRVRARTIYKIQNHKVNDYIVATQRNFNKIIRFLEVVLFIQRHRFIKQIVPSIPTNHPSNKKVLVIAMTYLQTGGVERVMLNIVKGINREKFEIHILTTSFSDNPWHNMFNEYVDQIIHIPNILDEHWTNHYRTRYVEEYVIRNNADILFITNAEVAYRALPQIKNNLSDIRVYDLLHTHGTPRDKDAYLRISLPFDEYINKRIVIDEYLKDYYVHKYPVNPDKIEVIYNGIDTKDSLDKPSEIDPIFSQIDADRKIVTFIGRLEFDKSPLRLVDIAAEIKKRELPVSILVVGDGTLMPTMITGAKNAGILNREIFFYGNSNDPLPIAEKSHYTLLVSNAEGIPMSVLESMSVSTPAIASAVGGIPEIIDDADDGFLVQISDLETEKDKIKAFTDAIVTACALSPAEYTSMGSRSKKKIAARFSHMPEIYEHLFETGEVVGERDAINEVYS